MKVSKQISIDVELIEKIQQDPFNVSELCNERIWEYYNNIEEVRENVTVTNIDEKIDALKVKKQEQEKKEITQVEMDEAGITRKHIIFLENMSINIMGAKDIKEAYKRQFNEAKDWTELLALKRKWT